MSTPTEVLQAALAGEHAAIEAYRVAAGRLTGDDLDAARTHLAAHRALRDRLTALLLDLGASPVPAPTRHDLPTTRTAAEARAALGGIETRLTAVHADVVGPTTGAVRALAVAATADCAVRAVGWGAPLEPFPGLPERSG